MGNPRGRNGEKSQKTDIFRLGDENILHLLRKRTCEAWFQFSELPLLPPS